MEDRLEGVLAPLLIHRSEFRSDGAATVNQRAQLALSPKEFSRATTLLRQVLALQQEVGDKRGIAAAGKNLAAVAREQADDVQARQYYTDGLRLYEELADRRNVAECRAGLADPSAPLDAQPAVA
jgi:hypothetical protein